MGECAEEKADQVEDCQQVDQNKRRNLIGQCWRDLKKSDWSTRNGSTRSDPGMRLYKKLNYIH